MVTDMESTYLTKIDDDARLQHIVYSRNTKQLNIPEGFSLPWGDSLCKRALDDGCPFSNDVATMWGRLRSRESPRHHHLFKYAGATGRRLAVRHIVRRQ